MLDFVDVEKSFGGRKLLGGVSFRINPGERWALVGPNGSGKTTILRMIDGEELPEAGTVLRSRRVDVGYLPQEIEVVTGAPLLQFVEDVDADVLRIREEIAEIEGRLGRGEERPELLDRYGALQARYEHLDGYRLRARAERILSGLGFREEVFCSPLSTFSGGWRMRAALARILLRAPDLVLLDEPTNHLDIDSLEWLEEFVRASRNAYLLVSHDVTFLDRVADGVLALEHGAVIRTKGGYRRYEESCRLREEQARAAYDNYLRRKTATQEFADRFRYKATKARQVQSRLRRLEKESPPAQPPPTTSRLALHLPQPERSGRTAVSVEGVRAGYGATVVYSALSLRVERGDKVALIGPNGAGKSTLLKLLAGVVCPAAGVVRYGHNVRTSYFAQHQLEQLDARRTVLEEMRSLPGLRTETELRTLLGAFLFGADDVDKAVGVLSGGEKTRLVLAKMLADPGNLFLLDEPTNHLDLQACAVLKEALASFDGTLCLITHDRDLINRVATRVLYVADGAVREYLGNYDDYLRKRARELPLGEERAPELGLAEAPRPSRREDRREAARKREDLRKVTAPLRLRVEQLEAEVAVAEARLAEVEAELSRPGTYAVGQRAAALARERTQLVERVERCSAEWEQAATRLEALAAAGEAAGP